VPADDPPPSSRSAADGAGTVAAPPPGRLRPDAVPGIERLLALSDGVVAIAITLLVLQLRVPPMAEVHDPHSAADLAAQLGNGGSQLLSYAVAFYVIARFWLAHHRIFRQLSGHHEGLAWWNFAFLMTITLMPFTSNLLGQFDSNPLAIDIFALNLLLAALATTATMRYARRVGLIAPEAARETLRAGQIRTVSLTIAVVLSMGIAWVDTTAAKLCWVLIAVLPTLGRRIWPAEA
jgi:uncharacterized membrane protein